MSVTQFPDLGSELTRKIIDCCIRVHRELGPGLLESVYEECLAIVLSGENIKFARQQAIPIYFEGKKIEIGFRLDFLIDDKIILELKAVEKLNPLYDAQILTYMKLSGIDLGLLINFNETLLKNGVKRFANSKSK